VRYILVCKCNFLHIYELTYEQQYSLVFTLRHIYVEMKLMDFF